MLWTKWKETIAVHNPGFGKAREKERDNRHNNERRAWERRPKDECEYNEIKWIQPSTKLMTITRILHNKETI